MAERYQLNNEEVLSIQNILSEIISKYSSLIDDELIKDINIYAHELPRQVRKFLHDFKYMEPSMGYCVISGYPVDEVRIGPTPSRLNNQLGQSFTLEEEVLLLLFSSLLGDAIGWATQQTGHLVHDVMPIKEYEDAQLGIGSLQTLWWHNEDAFHPYRGDYVCLMCLRNPDQVGTMICSINQVKVPEEHLGTLFKPLFNIHPDESHDEDNTNETSKVSTDVSEAYQRIKQINATPEKLPILFGDPHSPYLRIDPYYMDPPDDDEAKTALNTLVGLIDQNIKPLVLQAGDYLIIDNFRAVHGRRAFTARYDGTDRWLKRVNITRDLRKSRNARKECNSRIIF